MRARTIPVALALVTAVAVCAAARAQAPATAGDGIGAEARWVPATAQMTLARAACKSAPTHVGDCVIDRLKGDAPASALAFLRRAAARSNGDLTFMQAFRDTGPVSVAYLVHPLRANENRSVWLVNGIPDVVDVDDPSLVPREQMERDSIFASLVRRYGEVTIWPGDRADESDPTAAGTTGGGQRFTASFRLRKGCHACEVVGAARFAFDFDEQRAFKGVSLVSVTDRLPPSRPEAVPIGPAADEPGRTMHVQVNETFTIALDVKRAGEAWTLARDLDPAVLTLVDRQRSTARGTRLGDLGKDVWTFRALAPGRAELPFAYGRPSRPPTRTTTFTIVVR